jgi:hypothetical protein
VGKAAARRRPSSSKARTAQTDTFRGRTESVSACQLPRSRRYSRATSVALPKLSKACTPRRRRQTARPRPCLGWRRPPPVASHRSASPLAAMPAFAPAAPARLAAGSRRRSCAGRQPARCSADALPAPAPASAAASALGRALSTVRCASAPGAAPAAALWPRGARRTAVYGVRTAQTGRRLR